ncbi:hypothetical protein V1511DRAFT_497811 [Dipodascopsis uninucleata]
MISSHVNKSVLFQHATETKAAVVDAYQNAQLHIFSILIIFAAVFCLYHAFDSTHHQSLINPLDLRLLNYIVPAESRWPSYHYSKFLESGELIPLPILMDDLLSTRLQLRGVPCESLWQILRFSEARWSCQLFFKLCWYSSYQYTRPQCRRGSASLKKTQIFKYTMMSDYLDLLTEYTNVLVIGEKKLARHITKCFDNAVVESLPRRTYLMRALESTDLNMTQFNRVVFSDYNHIYSSKVSHLLQILNPGSQVMIQLFVINKVCSVSIWYAIYTKSLLYQQSSKLLFNHLGPVKKLLCKNNYSLLNIVDTSFDEAMVTKDESELLEGPLQIWKAWTSILLAEGFLKCYLVTAKKDAMF